MVSVRRRKLIGLCSGINSSGAPLSNHSDVSVPEKSEQTSKPVNVHQKPSVDLNQAVKRLCSPCSDISVPENSEQPSKPNNVHHKPSIVVNELKRLCTHYSDISLPEKSEQTDKPVNAHHKPSIAVNQAVRFQEEEDIIKCPPSKKQKKHVQIDPENPMEVHAYLVQLKENNKLEPGPMRRSGEMPVKEWMEKCYPHIFRVFPQNPKVITQFADKTMQNEFLYCHYWLFLFELRNLVLMDHHTSPEYVTSLGKVIEILENQGFDCRFMRSELIVVGNMIKCQQKIMLAEMNVIAIRIISLEKELQSLARNEAESDEGGRQIIGFEREVEGKVKQCSAPQKEQHIKRNGELNNHSHIDMEREYIEVILERHKKMLSYKEEEGKRLSEVMQKINQLQRHRAAASGL